MLSLTYLNDEYLSADPQSSSALGNAESIAGYRPLAIGRRIADGDHKIMNFDLLTENHEEPNRLSTEPVENSCATEILRWRSLLQIGYAKRRSSTERVPD